MKKLKTILLAGVLAFSVSSCTFLDVTPENVVNSEENYREVAAIYADFTGLISLLQDVADDLIFVSELRGDLLVPTTRAPKELQDIHTADATADNNALVNPAKYYNMVMNANDFLRNTVKYNADYPGVIPTSTYRQLIGGAICVRTWAYLTIGKLYGGAVYYDYSMTSEVNLTKLPYYDFDRLINELVYFMTTGVDRVNGLVNVNFTTLFDFDEKDEIWQRVSLQPDCILTELYLWQGDYQNAAKRGINAITGHGVADGRDNTGRYTLNTSWVSIYGESGVRLDEGMTGVFYDRNQNQINDLQAYFNYDRNYYLAPTTNFADLFRYDSYDKTATISSLLNYYTRLRYSMGIASGTDYVVNKFSQNVDAVNDNVIYLYRAGELYLMIAEALAHEKRFEAADSLVNRGANGIGTVGGYLPPFNTPIWAYAKVANIKGVRGRSDGLASTSEASYLQLSKDFLSPELTAVYNMPEEEQLQSSLYDEYVDRRTYVLDSIIADETARELAFEGKRWFTLLRMARNSGEADILAVPVSKKYPVADQASMLSYFRQEDNWFFDDGIKK